MPIMLSTQKVRTSPKNGSQSWFPTVGLSVDWAGLTCCFQLQSKGLRIGLDESAKSNLERLKFLPRSSFSLQINNYNFKAKTSPLIETLANLKGRELKWPSLLEVMNQQLKEVRLPEQVWQKVSKARINTVQKPKLTA